ncbi:tetratricopeptide repeat protein [Methylomonas paludis]|uniref:protein O-GlcNAc transferase n=1 Tax=Methylomonas paludis TaxID=1173101 RepID=A0A975ML62_9GAMM|nr:tetratricopeptide repeat protein [Methylomonas paludis]QWF69555.1 tetratricopeptide repeat protein [Methylomonas paludis]
MYQPETDPAQLLAQAMNWHRSGQLPQAEAGYRQLLSRQPDHFDALHLSGVLAAQTGRFEQAAVLIAQALAVNPHHAVACFNLANALLELHRDTEALRYYQQALALQADFSAADWKQGVVLHKLERYSEALACYERVIARQPSHAEAFNNRGLVLNALQQPAAAQCSFEQAIALQPDQPGAYYNLGMLLDELGHYEAALSRFDQALAVKPNALDTHIARGNTLQHLKHPALALDCFAQAIALQPELAAAHYNYGLALHELQRYSAAHGSFTRAITLDPDYAEAYCAAGLALHELKQHSAALDCFDRALQLQPDFIAAHNNRGMALQQLKQHTAALICFEQAITLDPEGAIAYCNRGVSLSHLRQYTAAQHSFAQALSLKPDYAEAYNNNANVLANLKHHAQALRAYEQALALKPDLVVAWCGCGMVLQELKRYADALACLHRALQLKPEQDYLSGHILQLKLHICDWRDLAAELSCCRAGIAAGHNTSAPFTLLAAIDDPALQHQAARQWAAEKFPPLPDLPALSAYAPHDKIRIGYFSADFHNHALAILIAELFEVHDRDHFEVIGFAFGADVQDAMRSRLEAAFSKVVDLRHLDDVAAARLVRSMEIDIAVNLGGYTTDNRTGIFALRAAPLQVNYLGYAGTMGATYMDYLLADPVLIPAHNRVHYSENIVYLPDSFLPCDTTRPVADTDFQRADFGLPADGFVFCCFNNAYKIQPAVFGLWLGILAAVPSAVLWLPEFNPAATANLLAATGQQGISADRLIFARQLPLVSEHLARLRLADLFLDTLPYNAHTTASDALWAGLPVLTCAGESFAGRVAASLLAAIGLPELITTTPADYQALAIELATQPRQLAAIKAKLAANRLTTPLFDIRRFTVHLEQAYRQMFSRAQAGLPPEDIVVKSI